MFETKYQPLAPRKKFFLRLFLTFLIGACIIATAVLIGTVGYRLTEHLEWIDAFVNASLTLSTMGMSTPPTTHAGKLFSAFYALFSGLMFVTIMGVIFSPVVHRCIHRFHLEYDNSRRR